MRKLSFALLLIGFSAFFTPSNAKPKIDKLKFEGADSLQRTFTDPICRMKIKSAGAKTYIFNKKTYYFCCENCKQKFIAEPDKYIKK